MPTISRFFGIFIRMHWDEQHRNAHLHACKAGIRNSFDIQTGKVLGKLSTKRRLSKKDEAMVRIWIKVNRQLLLENWKHVRDQKPLKQVPPLG